MKKSGIRLALTGALMVLPLLAAAFAVVAEEPAEIPAFTIESTSEGIAIPDELPAGLVTLTFENNNEAAIAPILARLNEDVTLDQFMEALSQGPEAAIPLVSLLGGTEIEPEESFTITFDFKPGDHVLLEFNSEIPVIEPFTVVGDEAEAPAELKAADVAGPICHAACMHLGAHIPNLYFVESVRAFYQTYFQALSDFAPRVIDGHLSIPEGPGLGVNLRPEALDRPDVIRQISEGEGLAQGRRAMGDHWAVEEIR
jgi:hypothetical protein